MSISLISAIGRDRAGGRRIDSRCLGGRSTGRAPQTRRIGLGYSAQGRGTTRRGSIQPPSLEARVLSFIDTFVIPMLQQLYDAVGYLGVFVTMVIESTLIPIPSELILPFAGY